jgi:hypothetical protein
LIDQPVFSDPLGRQLLDRIGGAANQDLVVQVVSYDFHQSLVTAGQAFRQGFGWQAIDRQTMRFLAKIGALSDPFGQITGEESLGVGFLTCRTRSVTCGIL